jgi:uncharacterized membrane protein
VSAPSPYYQPRFIGRPSTPGRRRWFPIVTGVILVGLAIVLLVLLFLPGLFDLTGASSYRYGPLGGAFFFLFILLIVFFIARVAFWSSRAGHHGRYGTGGPAGVGADRPARIARMRYARGEISREQYEQIMTDLRRPPGGPS